MPKKSCLNSATGGLYVTITSQVVMYARAERAETSSQFPLSPSKLLGLHLGNDELKAHALCLLTLFDYKIFHLKETMLRIWKSFLWIYRILFIGITNQIYKQFHVVIIGLFMKQ